MFIFRCLVLKNKAVIEQFLIIGPENSGAYFGSVKSFCDDIDIPHPIIIDNVDTVDAILWSKYIGNIYFPFVKSCEYNLNRCITFSLSKSGDF